MRWRRKTEDEEKRGVNMEKWTDALFLQRKEKERRFTAHF